jgi:hypothetical protein
MSNSQISRNTHEFYFTQFMSLLDTIHDYGNIGRAENVFNRNQENEDNAANTNSNSQEDISTSLNSILVDFVMLGYFHKYFRTILNLNDIYVTQEEKCNQANSSFVNMCKKFYFPTYADKLIFRSSNPEEIQKVLLFEELLKREITFDTSNIHNIDNPDIIPKNYVLLNLGNKGVEEKELKGKKNQFVDINDPINKAHTENGKLKKKYKIFTCEHVEKSSNNKIIFKYKNKSGLYNTNNPQDTLYQYLLKFLKCDRITFIRDANKIDKFIDDWKCYNGIFTKYDSFKRKIQTGGMPMVNSQSNSNNSNDAYSNIINEFQEYSLEKSQGELIFLDRVFVEYDKQASEFILKSSIKETPITININRSSNTNSKKYPKGLSQFLMLFDEINRKTFGYKKISSIGKDKKNALLEKIQKIGLKVIEFTYKITLKLDNEPNTNSQNKIQLPPDEFIKSLFDFKRAMDYLYVKACHSANTPGNMWYNFPGKEQGFTPDAEYCKTHKFVFVTGDRSAAAYSIYLGNPTIYTPVIPTTEDAKDEFFCHRGDHMVMIYNPMIKTSPRKNANGNAKVNAKNNADEEDDADEDDKVLDIFNNIKNTNNTNAALSSLFGELHITNDIFETYKQNCKTFMEQKNLPYKDRKRVLNVFNKGSNKTLDKINDKDKVDETERECRKFLGAASGGGNIAQTLSYKIPLNPVINFAEEGSPFYIFLHFYAQLEPQMTFFWFITYKTIFFICFGDDMDKADCETFVNVKQTRSQTNSVRNNSKPQGQSVKQTRSQLNSVPPEFMLIRNNNSFQQDQVQTPQRQQTQNSPKQSQSSPPRLQQVNNNTKQVRNTNTNKSLRRDK